MHELNRCPACGSEAVEWMMSDIDEGENKEYGFVACLECCVETRVGPVDLVIDSWNRCGWFDLGDGERPEPGEIVIGVIPDALAKQVGQSVIFCQGQVSPLGQWQWTGPSADAGIRWWKRLPAVPLVIGEDEIVH